MNRSPAQRTRLRQLWRDYHRDRTDPALHELALEYLDFIRGIATRLARTLPQCVDVEDLVQVGFLGLRRAIQSFDEGRNTQFTTFATSHVKGAMLDSIRADDRAPRTFRRLAARLADARQRLAQGLGRNPTDEELAADMRLPADALRRHALDARAIAVVPLPGLNGHPRDTETPARLPADPRTADPALEAAHADLKRQITKGFEREERLILILYYYESMTMREIGATLDISESRVSQIHASLLEQLKVRFAAPAAGAAAIA